MILGVVNSWSIFWGVNSLKHLSLAVFLSGSSISEGRFLMSLMSFFRFLMILGPIFDDFCRFCPSSVCHSSGPGSCVLSGDVIFDRFLMVFGRFLMVFDESEKMVFDV